MSSKIKDPKAAAPVPGPSPVSAAAVVHADPAAEGAGAAPAAGAPRSPEQAAGAAGSSPPLWDAAGILEKHKKTAVTDIDPHELDKQDVRELRRQLHRVQKWQKGQHGKVSISQLDSDFAHMVRKARKTEYWEEVKHRRGSQASSAANIPHDEEGARQADGARRRSPSWDRSSSPSQEQAAQPSLQSPLPFKQAAGSTSKSPSGSPNSKEPLIGAVSSQEGPLSGPARSDSPEARSISPQDGEQRGGSLQEAPRSDDSAAPALLPATRQEELRASDAVSPTVRKEQDSDAGTETGRSGGDALPPAPSTGRGLDDSGRAPVRSLPQTASQAMAPPQERIGALQVGPLDAQGEGIAGNMIEGSQFMEHQDADKMDRYGSGFPAIEGRGPAVLVCGVGQAAAVAAAAVAVAAAIAVGPAAKYARIRKQICEAVNAVDESRKQGQEDQVGISESNDLAKCYSAFSGCLYMLLPMVIMFLLLCLAGALGIAISDQEATRLPSTVTIRGGVIYVNGTAFVVKGVAYSPVWKGQDGMSKWPYGDHMFKPRVSHLEIPETFRGLTQQSTDFDRFDRFHLAKIKAAGFNTIRLYNWLLDKDHTAFLNSCHDYGLMVIITFWMDTHTYNPLADTDQRHKAKLNFEHLLRRYKDHPAVLMWALGNEPNLPGVPQSYYSQMPEFISLCGELREVRNRVEQTAAEPHPMIIPMAVTGDVNTLLKKYDMSTGFDLWGIQPYMSPSDLNTFLLNLDVENKPVLITEYGADSLYDDRRRRYSAFKRQQEKAVDEHAQVGQFINLTKILFKFLAGKTLFRVCMPQEDCDPDSTVSVHALPWPETVYDDMPVNEGRRNPETGYQELLFRDNGNPLLHLDKVVDDWTNANSNLQHKRYNRLAGLVVFEWMDEWWKGLKHDPDHSDCQQDNGYRQSSCGYFNVGFGRDWRVNEEYFGMAAQDDTGQHKDKICLRPKPMFYTSQVMFGNATDLSGVQPFCSECARSTSANSVDATYLTRLRVAAAPEDGRSDVRIAYGTRLIAKDTANATTWSFGEIFDAARASPRGVFNITDRSPKPMRINWRLSGVPCQCNADRTPSSANASCAVRIHETYTCSSEGLGGHFFRREPDPWQHPWSVKYTAVNCTTQAGASATGAADLDFGFRIPNAMGRAVVVYDDRGAPAACGVLNSTTGWAPAQAGVFELTSFPGKNIGGAINLTDVNKKPIRSVATFRGEEYANKTLTLKVLSGTDCLSAHSMGAPLFFDREEPWSSAAPNVSPDGANSTLALHFDNGYALADLFGQVVAVYSGADVVACAVMRRRSELEGFAVFGNVRAGGPWLSGDVDFSDQTQRELRFEWNMTNIAPNCSDFNNSSLQHGLACTISLRTVVGTDANGRDVAEWWDSGVTYHSDASGKSSGTMNVTNYTKAIGDLDGVSVDFRDEHALVSARGAIVVDFDTVTVRYDGYEEGAECACCVSSPLRQLVDLPTHYVLLFLGALLAFAIIVVCGFRVWAHERPEQGGANDSGTARDAEAARAQEESSPAAARDPASTPASAEGATVAGEECDSASEGAAGKGHSLPNPLEKEFPAGDAAPTPTGAVDALPGEGRGVLGSQGLISSSAGTAPGFASAGPYDDHAQRAAPADAQGGPHGAPSGFLSAVYGTSGHQSAHAGRAAPAEAQTAAEEQGVVRAGASASAAARAQSQQLPPLPPPPAVPPAVPRTVPPQLDECGQVQEWLEKNTAVPHVLAVMRIAFRNPPTMTDLRAEADKEEVKPRCAYDVLPAYQALVATIGAVAKRRSEKFEEELEDACKEVYMVTVPAECQKVPPNEPINVHARAPDEGGGGCFRHPATRALLYLAVQQRIEGLRQCRWFKVAAYNYILKKARHGGHREWAEAMQEVTVVVLHHLELVEQDIVNYADIDDTYHSLCQSQSIAEGRKCIDWLLSNTQCYGGKDYKTFEEAVDDAKKQKRLQKRFPERISWFVPLRLFSFTIHVHIVLFYAAVALNVRLSLDTTWWLLGACEAIFCLLNFLVDVWLFPWPRFCIRLSALTALNVAGSVAYFVMHLKPASQGGPELGYWRFGIVWLWVSEAIVRPLWTLHTKRDAHPDPWRFLGWRWLTLFFMFLLQMFIALFFIAPGISTMGISLCRCPVAIIKWLAGNLQGKASECTADIRDQLCFLGVSAFFLCTFLSLTLMAHVSYMLLSIACGYIVGIGKKLGVAKTWRQAQAVMQKDRQSGGLGIYGTLQPAEEEWLYASMFRHMWERDLISSEHCKAYCDPSSCANAPPPPEEALVQILQFQNGHAGLKSEFEFEIESTSDDTITEKKKEEEKTKYREALSKCVSVSRMPSLSVMVPYYNEAVLYLTKDLREGLLRHMASLWPEEWRIFCERTFFGYSNAQRLLEAFEAGDDALRIWMDCRDRWEDDRFKCAESLAQRKKWSTHHWRYDPPPPSLLDDPDLAKEVLEAQMEDNLQAREEALRERLPAGEIDQFRSFCTAHAVNCIDPRVLPVVAETCRQTAPELFRKAVLMSAGDLPLHPKGMLKTGPLPHGDLLQSATVHASVLASGLRAARGAPEIGRLAEPLNSVWRKSLREAASANDDIAKLLDKHRLNVQYWLELQVRLWASLRGQTLARLVYGLHEMREAVCDLAYFELRSAQEKQEGAGKRLKEGLLSLTERSTVLDVCAWVHQGVDKDERWNCPEARGYLKNADDVPARVADLLTFACRYWRLDGAQLFRAVALDGTSPRDSKGLDYQLTERLFQSRAVKWCMPMFAEDGREGAAEARAQCFVHQVCAQLPGLIRRAVLRAVADAGYREDAEKLVSRKIQLCFGAQAYWADQAVRRATDELLRMDRLRHLEIVTDKQLKRDAKTDALKAPKDEGWVSREGVGYAEFNTIHVRRKHAATNRTNFLRQFGPPEWWENEVSGGRGNADKATYMREGEESMFEFTIFHRLRKLVLGEPKAENQNNIITCARGEVLQMLDMNQDAYYAEGIKLPLVLQLWDKSFRASSEAGREVVRVKGRMKGKSASADAGGEVQPGSAAREITNSYHLLGFREHIFTESHSAVGRYMALAEFSFVTLIQRFLANPHEVRMHYGHPDMVKAAHMKQTGGVSRSSKGVNVNEDIFLGYEMAATGRDTAMIEYISYGKGREVDFNNASVFLKKLSAGAVLQLGSRQVYKLYTEELWTPQKWALFYGSLAHFINIYLTDFTIFLFTYVLMIFALADLTPQNFRLLESPLSDPWLIQVGMFYILPMVVERNLERSYLHASDFVMSIPFFAHQNRITASYFGSTMHMSQGNYKGTGRGMGHKRSSMVTAYLHHTTTNFIPGLRLLLCAAVYYWAGYGCAGCRTTDSDMFRLWIVLISAFSYLMAPSLYNPKPTFSAVWREWAESLAWISANVGDLRYVRYHSLGQCKEESRCWRQLPPGRDDQRREQLHKPDKRIGLWVSAAKGSDGQERSMRVLWVLEWLEYLNAKGLNAAGASGCERVQGAVSVFVRELMMIVSKYGLWVTVPVVAFSMSRGDATTETAPDGTTIKVEPPRMLEFSWVLFTFIVLDVSIYIMGECFTVIMNRVSAASRAERIPRLIRLFVLPVLYIFLIVLIFLGSDHPLDEALAEFLFYNVFAGIGFATITELTLAVIQFRINIRKAEKPQEVTNKDKMEDKKEEKEEKYKPQWRREFEEQGRQAKLRENHRLDVLLWMSRWNPLILYYQRMYLLVSLCLMVPNAVLAAIARLHTTWLFTEHVARNDAGKD